MSDQEPTVPAWNQPFTTKECQAMKQWLTEERRTEPSLIIDPKTEEAPPGDEHEPGPLMLMAGRSGSWKRMMLEVEAERARRAGKTFVVFDPKAGFDPFSRP